MATEKEAAMPRRNTEIRARTRELAAISAVFTTITAGAPVVVDVRGVRVAGGEGSQLDVMLRQNPVGGFLLSAAVALSGISG